MPTPATTEQAGQQIAAETRKKKKRKSFFKIGLAIASIAIGAALPIAGAGLLAYALASGAATTAGAIGLGVVGAIAGGIAGSIAGGIVALPGQLYLGVKLFKKVAKPLLNFALNLLLGSPSSEKKPAAAKPADRQAAPPAAGSADKPAVADKAATAEFKTAVAANTNEPAATTPAAKAIAPKPPKQ